MEESASVGPKRFELHLASTEFVVAPGDSLSIPVLIYSEGAQDLDLALSIRGVPSHWLSVPSPAIHLAPGEQRETAVTIQPPAFPQGHAGRHTLAIRVANEQAPAEAVEKTCTLTVAAMQVPGRIGLLLAATEFSVVPGRSVSIPLVLLNQGLDADTFALSVEGIPSAWVYAASAAVSLAPGRQQEVTLTVQPPASAQIRAGRHPFRILVHSQGAPGQAAAVPCVLTIATMTLFSAELRPQSVDAGQPARVFVENQGNVQQAFEVSWHSPDDQVLFEPSAGQQVRVPPGEVGTVESVPRPRSRPLLGRGVSLPFTTRVQAPSGETRNVSGEVRAGPLLPAWVLPALGIAILALIAVLVLTAVLGGGDQGPAPTEAPATEAPPAVDTEVPPTEVPPEQPTEPPPEPTQPPEQPTEPPEAPTQPPEQPTEPPPEAPTAEETPGGGGEGPDLPCLPAALAPFLVGLSLTRGRKR